MLKKTFRKCRKRRSRNRSFVEIGSSSIFHVCPQLVTYQQASIASTNRSVVQHTFYDFHHSRYAPIPLTFEQTYVFIWHVRTCVAWSSGRIFVRTSRTLRTNVAFVTWRWKPGTGTLLYRTSILAYEPFKPFNHSWVDKSVPAEAGV